MTRRLMACTIVIGALLTPGEGRAQNRGVYPLGMSATASGRLPAGGFTYTNQLLYYSRDHARDDEGNETGVTGDNSVLMDMNTVAWVPGWTVLGARYACSATIPLAKNELTSDIAGPISGGSGLADSYYLPVILGWTGECSAIKAMYGFLAPTGRFEAGADDNVGSGYWTHAFSGGATFDVGGSRWLALSGFAMLELHTTQEGTGITPGNTLDFEGSALAMFARGTGASWSAGPAGYAARQVSARDGDSLTPAEKDSRYAVNALGAAVAATFPNPGASFALKAFHEFSNRSTYQGWALQLVGSIHL